LKREVIYVAANRCIDVITRNLLNKINFDYQYLNLIHFVLFVASMQFNKSYNINQSYPFVES